MPHALNSLLGDGFALGGHRGCGVNLVNSSGGISPGQRENTIKSFQEAVRLGVSFVEFDVQVTSDGVPVIWHDDTLITESAQHEIKELTLQQFKGMVTPPTSASGSWTSHIKRNFYSKQPGAGRTTQFLPWVCTDDDTLPTLQEVFQALPDSVGFDVEVKMSVPSSVEVTAPEEVQRMVQPIMACVNAATAVSPRTIVYSSFDPDICVALKQSPDNRHAVMFLSGCGLYPHVDPRRTSVPAALAWAASHSLQGIVVPTSILMANPGMVAEAQQASLHVMTYGLDNDSPDGVRKQQALGVHAAIVDDVAGLLPQLD